MSGKEKPPICLRGFEHINRYIDRHNNNWVAKILPGEFYVTRLEEYIATTLGSCVSACIWDEKTGIGGMNHFMLPETSQASHSVTWGNLPSQATRYGNYAMEHLINTVLSEGGLRNRLRAKVFGGGRVMKQQTDIGARNAEFVLQYLGAESIPILSQDLFKDYARKLLFFPRTGQVLLKRIQTLHNDTILSREQRYQSSLQTKELEGDIELFDD